MQLIILIIIFWIVCILSMLLFDYLTAKLYKIDRMLWPLNYRMVIFAPLGALIAFIIFFFGVLLANDVE